MLVRSFVVAVPKELLPLLLFVCSLLNLFNLSSGFILVNVAANEQPSDQKHRDMLVDWISYYDLKFQSDQEEGPVAKRQKEELKAFNDQHLNGILADGTWEDQETFSFTGRNQFVDTFEKYLTGHLHSPVVSPQDAQEPEAHEETDVVEDDRGSLLTPPDEPTLAIAAADLLTPPPAGPSKVLSAAPSKKRAKALVYSSVSGTGKTVSMLELKRLLHKENRRIAVAYLGFNCCLGLLKEEKDHMKASSDFTEGAREVLARRLAGSTIISLRNPGEVSRLPKGEKITRDMKFLQWKNQSSYSSKEPKLQHMILSMLWLVLMKCSS